MARTRLFHHRPEVGRPVRETVPRRRQFSWVLPLIIDVTSDVGSVVELIRPATLALLIGG